MDSLVRKALLGDREAQRECTEEGIVLPCPLCGNENNIISNWGMFRVWCPHCKAKSEDTLTTRDALKSWNTRPAPPIGRCGECKNFKKHKNFTHPEYMFDGECKRFKSFNSEYAFCSNFEPREE